MRVSLFSKDYSLLKQTEVVEEAENQAIIHIASYNRLVDIFTRGGKSCIFHFKNPDDYEQVWACSSKVWLKKNGFECVGYVLSEDNDEIIVMLVEHNFEKIKLTRPCYNVNKGRYFVSESHSKCNQYEFVDYWPVRFKIQSKGRLYFTCNRIKFEYKYDTNDLMHNTIIIKSNHINKVESV